MRTPLLVLAMLAGSSTAVAADGFSGRWTIDLRSPEQVESGLDCGFADFDLVQAGERLTGTHSFGTPGCGRVNDSGPVSGVVVGPNKAVLIVTSDRTGAIAYGVAELTPDRDLDWRTVGYVQDTDGDSPLILGQGRLHPPE